MDRFVRRVVAMTAALVIAGGGQAAERLLYRNGEPQGLLFLPETATHSPVRLAEAELQEHLQAIAGKRLEAVTRAPRPGEPGLALILRPGPGRGEPGWSQRFSIRADPEAGQVRLEGNTELALLYGAYEYLDLLGVRWLTPGAAGTVIPRKRDIAIEALDREVAPSFVARTFALSSTADNHFGGIPKEERATAVRDYQLYLLRNRSQLGRFAAKGFAFGLFVSGTGHSVKPMTGLTIPLVKGGLMERSPERFALVTGPDFVQKRRYDDGQVCFSNEENIRTAISNAIAFFREKERTRVERNADLDAEMTFPLGLSDCNGICECEACSAIAGEGPNRKDRLVWKFWNRVARELNRACPGRVLAVCTPYMELTAPPPDVASEPNILAVTPLVNSWEKGAGRDGCPFPATFRKSVARIRESGADLACYNYLNFPWSPTPLHLLDGVKAYRDLGYRNYQLEAMQRTEYAWPLVWSLARYTWDSSRSPREWLAVFCRDCYGEAAGRDVVWLLEGMTRQAERMERINFGGGSDTAMMFPDGLIAEARPRLAGAVEGAQGPAGVRMKRFAESMEAQFRLAETYRAYARALNERSEEAIAGFRACAEGLIGYWEAHGLEAITTLDRTPAVAARMYMKTDFAGLKPQARAELAGKGPGDPRWMQELFAGAAVPEQVRQLHPLPECWKFRLDPDDRGLEEGWFREAWDDRAGWPPVSTWSMPSAQGYHSQVGGYFWYRLAFEAPRFPERGKVILRIGSLDDSGDVYLNGVKVGSQPDPFNWDKSFALDVTAVLRGGATNVLAIRGYDSGGGEGVWRPSALYFLPE